ncbi:4,4'-diaponeurosporenoate glycosyltransferase [Alkalibacterium putridalgicola]|uniref:4,4'-diaponeurosporenoate glycosyltransferase n=1 Tax=Alkalibacterium putridalgicola TaxID=426703 RepID=A0A1H7XS87_9LACT|nr:glycosyltransferase family 2 protein [Alkalibacterium putridalgicola]GEK90330.1 4,4'-diaponeurosporenoate glycosyltransferase [Alkalibacterium putridalgicola]SEM35849.1 4,4'-diaponeurosporenoate glycosyltransferase [Alkalibacterium putridalgicola]
MAQVILLFLLLIAFLSGFFFLWKLPVINPSKDKEEEASISVIVPARDEETSLPKLLASLHEQSLVIEEIIVVDDESEDRTVKIAEEYGATVLSTKESGSTRTGKSAACWLGAQHAKGDYLIFMDSDTQCAQKHAFRNIVAQFKRNGDTGLLSIQPYHVIRSLYETLSIVPNIIVLAGLNRYTFLDKSIPKRGAFGPFLFVKAEEYFDLGGHEATLYTHMDGIAMADLYQKENCPVTVYGGKESIHFRMYPEGIYQLIQGWTKSFTYGAKVTHPVVMLSIMLWVMSTYLVLIGFVDGVMRVDLTYLSVIFITYVLHSLQFRWLMKKVGRFPWWTMAFSLIYISAFLLLYLWAVIQVYFLKKVKWRGREYKT